MPSGIVIIDKPAGWTSMDVCAKMRGILREKRVGHGGTLDPMATGVLPVFVGQATRAVEFAENGEKAEPKCIGGGTYAKSMPNIVAFGPIFPGDEVREHKPDEYMETRRVMQNAEIIASAMKALAE